MFNWFKKKKQANGKKLQIVDIHNQPLQEGDKVVSLRYDLGVCKLISDGNSFFYESIENGKKVSWLKMIDAVTAYQKVEKISS